MLGIQPRTIQSTVFDLTELPVYCKRDTVKKIIYVSIELQNVVSATEEKHRLLRIQERA